MSRGHKGYQGVEVGETLNQEVVQHAGKATPGKSFDRLLLLGLFLGRGMKMSQAGGPLGPAWLDESRPPLTRAPSLRISSLLSSDRRCRLSDMQCTRAQLTN